MKTIKNLTADQIRKSILQLAIEGKLVKQDPNDEPASELVKKIMAEKKRLIQEGKIKKDKNESYIFKGDDNCYYEKIGNNEPVKLEDLPFDIPDSWAWIRISSFANVYNGNSINETEKAKKYTNVKGRDFIATKDITFDKTINYDNGVYIPEKESKFKVAPANKILMCIEGGSAGRKIAITSKAVCFGNKLACFNTFVINDLYLYSVLQSNTFLDIFKSSLSGIIGGVSINNLKNFLIPLPPLAEQLRIVDRMAFIEPLLAKYDSVEKKLSALEAGFPERLKKSILQYAIEGKLVKQDPNDEPASVLLERIKAEKERLIREGKIKRDKNESYIYQGDDKNYYEKIGNNSRRIEVPFESNENSIWVRLATICTKIVDGNHNPPKGELFPTNYLMLSSQNINDDSVVNLNICRYLTEERFEIENSRTSISLNDILFTSVGTLGRTCVYVGPLNICFQRSVTVISTLINPRYLKMFLDTPMFQFKVYKEATGTAQKGFYLNQLASSFVLIYPSDYQNRVVAKTDDLFKIIQ